MRSNRITRFWRVIRFFMRPMLAHAALASFGASAALAASAIAPFAVTVKLNVSGTCTSTALSQQTRALVQVTCDGGQFVSIEQQPGQAFVGVHGGAYRFAFGGGARAVNGQNTDGSGELDLSSNGGTITALRVLDLTERDERLELLVSF